MRTVIFLDIDGVLNTDYTRDRCCGYTGIEDSKVQLLKQLVDVTDADIVLISTWRTEYKSGKRGGSTRLGHYMVDKLKKYDITIYDKTPNIMWRARAKEIHTWVEHNTPINRIIILDDEDFYYDDDLSDYWVCTRDPYACRMWPGLTQENVDYIINHLDDFNVKGCLNEY